MKGILLLTDRQSDFGTTQCVEQLLTGLAGDYALEHLPLPPGVLARQLTYALRLRRGAASAHLVHAFGYRAMQLATLLVNTPILYTPLPDDPPKAVRWVRAAMARRTMRLLCLDVESDRMFVSGGVPPQACHLTRPGTRSGKLQPPDPSIRKQLGITPEQYVILAVGDSRRYSNHTMALHATSILNSIDPRWRLLIWGEGPAVSPVTQLHEDWGIDILINARERLGPGATFTQVIAAANVGLVTAPGTLSPAPLLACMSNNLPLVAPATRAVSDLLEDRHTAMLYAPTTARMAAQRLLALSEDTTIMRRITDQARAEAYELFSVSRFLDTVRQIYA